MAQQITIDIVAETKKLTSGINDANGQIDTMSTKLKGIAGAAGVAASGFLATKGLTFLKQGIDEAKEAAETMRAATTTFGEGSAALEKITADADKFGKAIAVDNDVIIQLSTQLGSRLPADAKALSAEIVNLGFDIEAYTGGAVTADAVTAKLAKAFVDGELTAKEMTKIFPDLSDATYAQAEALSKAGKNQEALTLLIEGGSKKYGDAAEKNVTSSQKFDTALADLKETVGTSLLPFINKLVDGLTTLLEWFDKQPDSVKKVEIALGLLVTVGGLALTFLASMKASLVTLGITQAATTATTATATGATVAQTTATGAATTAQRLFNITMLANPITLVIAAIVAIIAIIVLLVKNWDTVTEVVSKVWDAIKNFAKDAWNVLKDFGSKVGEFVLDIIEAYLKLPKAMLSVGKDIVSGIWNGMKSMAGWLKDKVFDFFGNLIPGWAKKVLGISSPSKVFARYGRFIVEGLAVGIERSANIAKAATEGLGLETIGAFGNAGVPRLATGQRTASAPITVNINAGLGTDPYELGRVVNSALKKYNSISAGIQ
jgi:hypothetical protein